MNPKIYISGDHAGFKLKEKLKSWLNGKGFEIKDFGPYKYNKQDNYPDFVVPMARAIVKEQTNGRTPKRGGHPRGLIIAGSGQGENIAVNKLKGIKCALYHGGNPQIVRIGRAHDDANVLSFGSRFVSEKEAKKAIDIFLNTKFDGGRHAIRLGKYAMLGSK